MSKPQKKPQTSPYDREEKSRHYYKIQKTQQDRKMMRGLDKALKSKDYSKLINQDVY